jgi:hypothetical protein
MSFPCSHSPFWSSLFHSCGTDCRIVTKLRSSLASSKVLEHIGLLLLFAASLLALSFRTHILCISISHMWNESEVAYISENLVIVYDFILLRSPLLDYVNQIERLILRPSKNCLFSRPVIVTRPAPYTKFTVCLIQHHTGFRIWLSPNCKTYLA